MRGSPLARKRFVTLLLALLLAGAAAAERLVITVPSGPPEYVTGGDARLLIEVPQGVELSAVSVWQGTRDVTADFAPYRKGHALEGLVTGLPLGDTVITVLAGLYKDRLTLTNHRSTDAMFSGPQQEPFFCATESHRDRAALGDILDDDCSMETRVDFLYWSTTADDFLPYDAGAARPDDMATVTLPDGREVDAIVRWERGTLDRFIYSIAMLSPNGQDAATPDLSAWNRRLIYQFQGGVGVGHYQGSPSRGYMLNPTYLGLGYAIAYSTGTKTDVHYNLIVGGETALMVKDRFVSAYGVPDYTVGLGGSGGGIQQYIYGQNLPGLLDALIPQYPYPDMVTQTIHVGDCELLERWMDAKVAQDPDSKWATWSNRTILEGMAAWDDIPNPYFGGEPGLTECINGWRGLSPLALNPHFGTAPGITAEQQAAVDWTHFEDAVQVYGRRADGYARSTWDNVGVQYGLVALNQGQITPAEFLDLNAFVGGWKDQSEMVQEGCPFIEQLCDDPTQFDPWSSRNMNLSPDGLTPAPRTAADPGAIDAVLSSGLYFRGELNLPTIDVRHYLERELDMHNTRQSFVIRERIKRNGSPEGNQVIWFVDAVPGEPRYDPTLQAFQVIDQWMANLEKYPGISVAEARPARAVDSCFAADGELQYAGADAWWGIIDDHRAGPCAERYKIYGTSRTQAGAPFTGDAYKCDLQPVRAAVASGVYGDWRPTDAQVARLEAIFPTGVCKY